MIINNYHTIKYLLYFFLISFCAISCGDDDDNSSSTSNQAYWKNSSIIGSDKGSATLIISGTVGKTWTAEITEGSGWCSFSYTDFNENTTATSGIIKSGLNTLYVYCAANSTSNVRTAKISVCFDGGEAIPLELIQQEAGHGNNSVYVQWTESPQFKADANYLYTTHYVTIAGLTARNYSLCYDITRNAALWVAYPIHSAYLGSISRSEEWAFDPQMPSNYQPDCTLKSYQGSYDRGHQLPSADRLATAEMNRQTFYMSNMTPQLNRLNQDMWAKLEAKVRTYKCNDTLFVVTGAYFGNSVSATTDGAGKTVPIPSHYYKILLRTRSGKTGKAVVNCTTNELKSIGFWVEHKSYGNIEPPRSICVKVSDIEKTTGFTFFPQIPQEVKEDCNPTDWNITN